jgi:hypothetical protein
LYQNPVLRWLNHSTSVTDDNVVAVMEAIREQVHADFGPIWHTGCREQFAGAVAQSDWVIEILDNADVQGALGYHDLESGRPWMKVFAQTCAEYGVAWSSCASHEVLEALADPYIDRTIQTKSSTFTAIEVCDPCETITYNVNGIEVSDFVTPRWFDDQAPFSLYDFQGKISAALQLLPGGYIGEWTPNRGWGSRNAEGAVAREHRKRRETFEADGDK